MVDILKDPAIVLFLFYLSYKLIAKIILTTKTKKDDKILEFAESSIVEAFDYVENLDKLKKIKGSDKSTQKMSKATTEFVDLFYQKTGAMPKENMIDLAKKKFAELAGLDKNLKGMITNIASDIVVKALKKKVLK